MPHIAQHSAAELWELCRDHYVEAANTRVQAQMTSDPQLRSTLERHSHQFEQAASRLEQFMRQPGSLNFSTGFGGAPSFVGQTSPSGHHQAQYGTGTTAVSPQDVAIAAGCLSRCKAMAVNSIWGATEASEPARSFLHQLAGEHLRMAEEHYHWLEQRGAYASPHADHSTINQYSQQLLNYSQLVRQPMPVGTQPFVPQAVAQTGGEFIGVAPQQTQVGWNISPSQPYYSTAPSQHYSVGSVGTGGYEGHRHNTYGTTNESRFESR